MSPAVARAVVVGGFLLALALKGGPAPLVVPLTLALAAVWALPLLVAPRRRRPRVPTTAAAVMSADDQPS